MYLEFIVYQFSKGTISTDSHCELFFYFYIDQFHILPKSRPVALAQYTNLAAGSCAEIPNML